MKDLLTDSNFPRTSDGRVYHLGIRAGELANRIVTVGPPDRAEKLAKMLDQDAKVFRLTTDRGFLTITGRYHGVPISIVAIGMGSANCDFFVRECRESLQGDMVVIRLGSCGTVLDVPVGSIAVPRASVAVNRNYDFHFGRALWSGDSAQTAYNITRPVPADPALYEHLVKTLKSFRPSDVAPQLADNVLNASGDSFYGAQGRQTSFPDFNSDIISQLMERGVGSIEMETFHLYHLASVWDAGKKDKSDEVSTLPSTDMTAKLRVEGQRSDAATESSPPASPTGTIRAAAAQMIFAARKSSDFITPQQVEVVELWAGRAILESLKMFDIPAKFLHPRAGSVWE